VRLSKRQAEELLASYDDDPESALTAALRRVLGRPDLGFDALVADAGLSAERAAALTARHLSALDALARELNEQRTVDRDVPSGRRA
jgi:hypothetical protein